MRTAVIGLGEVGLPTALYLQHKEFEVFGVDIKEEVVNNARKKNVNAMRSFEGLPKDIKQFIVCVDTKFLSDKIDISSVISACSSIAQYFKENNHKGTKFVSIESTTTPGTLRSIWTDIFKENKDIFLVHVPQRFWSEDPEGRGVQRNRLIGVLEKHDEALAHGLFLYQDMLKMTLTLGSAEEVEFAKIAENAYRYIQIAIAEEFKLLCKHLGLDFDRVRDLIMTASPMHWIAEARDGIGGHCLPMAIEWMKVLGKSFRWEMIEASTKVDNQYKQWLQYKTWLPENRGGER